ncbi:MAG: hypothetical protein E8D49_15325 [Nitrospira sp.]|nr:MAG: hypothetical protein E8D49_15325 [Nitrospira sp.]
MSPAVMTLISTRGTFLLRKAHEIAIHSTIDTGDVDAVVILAATGLEAFLNELERLADMANVDPDGRLRALGQMLGEAEKGRAQLSLKYELAYSILTGNAVKRGSASYQALSRLIALRNDLVHPKPIVGNDRAKLAKHPHVRYFLDRSIIGPEDMSGHLTWDRVVLTPAVAVWAYDTAVRSIAALIEIMPQCPATSEFRRCWPENVPKPSSGSH